MPLSLALASLSHVVSWQVASPTVPPPRADVHMGKKTSFAPYKIDGESTLMFPLPADRDAIGVHKKHYPKGTVASKAAKDLKKTVPNLDANYPGMRVLHLDPPVLIVDDFFSEAECDAYAALRDGPEGMVRELAQSATFSDISSSARTSTTWFVAYESVMPTLLSRAAALLGVEELARFEEPQLVRYRPGQCFNWHYDAVPPTLLGNGGQRVATLLVYLNDVHDGGCTAFRDLRAGGTDANGQPLRLAVTPKKGRALLFFPSDPKDGVPDERTLHAGEPTEGGGGEEKWIAQIWLHAEAYASPMFDAPS